MRAMLVTAALLGLACVGFGAFGAHGVSDPKAQEWLRTGAMYGFVHVLAIFLAERYGSPLPPLLFLAGIVFFSGSLFAMGFGAPRWFGAITPIGGLSFMAGWAALAWAVARRQA